MTRSAVILTGFAAALAACGSAPEKIDDAPAESLQDRAAPPDAAGAVVASRDGTYRVLFSPTPERMPLNELFSMEVRLLANDAPAGDDVDLTVDAAMPAHRHGMNTVPRVRRRADGLFVVDGMQLHMPGSWELYFDVTSDGLTERLVAPVELE